MTERKKEDPPGDEGGRDIGGHPGAFGSAEKVVPKFCTSITMALFNNKNIVLSMMYGEGNGSAVLIDRVAIDLDHALSLRNTLTTILNDVGYENVADGN